MPSSSLFGLVDRLEVIAGVSQGTVDQMTNAQQQQNNLWALEPMEHPSRAAGRSQGKQGRPAVACTLLLLGNEDTGIDPAILPQCTGLLNIPCAFSKTRSSGGNEEEEDECSPLSLNVGNACAIALSSVSRRGPRYIRVLRHTPT
jgi:tRNA G18 (ribose-2'-O)-methylase SpoU